MHKKESKRYALAITIISLLCILSYSNALNHGFILDDYEILLYRIARYDHFFLFFTQSIGGFYRPLGAVFLKAISLLFGFNPIGYHVANLILFIIICSLFFFIIEGILAGTASKSANASFEAGARSVALMTACLYCVHPINNMIVNYKTASMLAVFIIFMQLSCLFFIKYICQNKRSFYLLSIFFYLCSLFSHEMACILPIYLFIIISFVKSERFQKTLLLFVPYVLCFLFYLFFRLHSQSRPVDTLFHMHLSFGVYFATISELLQWYVTKLFIPFHFLFLWEVPVFAMHLLARSLWLVVFLIIIADLYFIFIKLHKRFEILCLSWFLTGFIPFDIAAFTYTPVTHTAMIEPHWFYFSSLGFFMFIANAFLTITEQWKRQIRNILFCSSILILILLTRASNLVWDNEITYCKYWISLNHFSATPRSYLMYRYHINIPEDQ